jgi:hypothetical protein
VGDLDISGRILYHREEGCENVDRFQPAHGRVQCHAFLGIIAFGFWKIREFFDPLNDCQLFMIELA